MFSKSLEATLNQMFDRAKEERHEFMTVEHLLLALIENPEVAEVLICCGANLQRMRAGLTIFVEEATPRFPEGKELSIQSTLGFQRVLQRAVFQAQSIGKLEVSAINVLAAIFGEDESQAVYFLTQENITRADVMANLSFDIPKLGDYNDTHMHLERPQQIPQQPSEMEAEGFPAENPLERYTTNLNEKAREGKVDALIGREEEVMRMMQILCRCQKNNPLLVGDAGVGKTAIVEGLARMIIEGRVPKVIANSTIYNLDLGSLLAGTKYRGDFEKRLKSVLKALQQTSDAIIFIDEIHTLIGAGAASGGSIDAANLMKPLLSTGELKCIGSTTWQEYRSTFEKDHALARRFQKIDILEPSVEQTYEILKGLREKFEHYHSIVYSLKALKAAAVLAERYLNERKLPDKAIDVIDEAAAFQYTLPAHKRKKIIGSHEIEEVIAKMAHVPSANISMSDKEALQHLERDLKLRVFGQDKAIESLASAIKLSRSGLREPEKPIGSFLFSGPTGVGKTEVAQQLAKILGIELIRFDMSEYMERHAVSRLIGAPPGYVGYEQSGLLTEAVTKNPHAVLLLDEVEKAHPEIFNILLQVMDHGSLTDNNGRVADFRHVVVIMTTNAGAEEMERQHMGFSEQHLDHVDDLEAVNRLFSPEFRNRLDSIISFGHLGEDTLNRVVDKFIVALEVQLHEKNIILKLTQEARRWLTVHGYDRKMGARPMARVIQENIKRPLAEELLFGQLVHGGTVSVAVVGDKLSLQVMMPQKEVTV